MSLSIRILIIDDNQDIVLMLKTMLQLKGYVAEVKTNVHRLEEYLQQSRPDLILMDMLLSGADGRKVCANLKRNIEFATIPVLMISAHPTAKEECLKSGADFFLAKPFDMHNLLSAIDSILHNNRQNVN